VDVPVQTYFGNPNDARVRAQVNMGSVGAEHQFRRVTLRNRVQIAGYDRGYQNYVPGAVDANKVMVAITGYNNATARLNFFNQTDAVWRLSTGRIQHTVLSGVEIGRQLTDNFRNTGYFNNTATSVLAPLSNPVINTPIVFRQSTTDAKNHLQLNLGAAFVQDQIALSRFVQVLAGVRVDHFDLRYDNLRNSEQLRRIDNLVSPRAGLVFKPITAVSLYTSYSVSYLPSSGDQFASLTSVTQQLKPEKFTNYEAGIKWDLRSMSLTAAVYRLDRTNTRAVDPFDPTRIVQTGSQRSNGFELGVNGRIRRGWQIAGGYAYQDAFIRSATTAALAGAQVAQVPHHMFSLWNHYQFRPRWGAGLGVLNRSDMFTAIDNTVVLPSYTRVDAALFYQMTERVRLQANVENLTGRQYYINADGNNNISPGSPRAVRVGMIARF
jgi:catecholate siderophore receptor